MTEIQMVNSRVGWGFGGLPEEHVHLLRTSDGGRTWQDVSPPVPGPEAGVNLVAAGAFLDGQTAKVIFYLPPERGRAQNVVFWSSDDGGLSWNAGDPLTLGFIGVGDHKPFVRFVDSDHGWILIRYGGEGMHKHPVALLATEDGGRTWEWLLDYWSDEMLSCFKSGMAFGDAAVGFVTIEQCPIDGAETDWTYDGGASWTGHTPPLPFDELGFESVGECAAHSPQFVSASQAFAAADCPPYDSGSRVTLLLSTRDAGVSWEIRLYPGGALLFIDGQTGWALGRDIYRTTDAGHSWEWLRAVNWDGQFSFVSPFEGWAVARSESEVGLMRTPDGGATWEILEPVIGR